MRRGSVESGGLRFAGGPAACSLNFLGSEGLKGIISTSLG